MKALAYLLGARALDIARDAEPPQQRVPEVSLGPIASTPETASAWRRWAEARETLAPVAAERRPRLARPSSQRTPTAI